MRHALFVILAFTLLVGCDDPGGKVVGIDQTGVVSGIAFIDRNADGRLTLGIDVFVQGVRAALLLDATGDTINRATSDASGVFTMQRVPIGRYRLVAHRGSLGDTVQVLTIDSAQFALAAGDTVIRFVPLGFPTIAAAAVRTTPAGRRVMVQGIALNGWTAFGDSTIHVADGSGAIRAVRVLPTPVQAGDSVRLLGTTGTRDGHVVIADASALVLSAAAGLPAADSVSTADAASAAAGSRDDGQVRIAGAVVSDTATVAGDLVLGVTDGSGRLEVVLDRHVAFNPGQYIPGATFHGAGVLVPTASGAWQLKPRERGEANITFPAVTIAVARTLELGRRVVVAGIALNGWSAFGDSTVHVRDATGAIRGIRVLGAVAAGDSVRLLGTLATRDGQPVLTAVTATTLRAGVGVPQPDSISTAIAASAEGGSRDADQVRIAGPITGAQNLPSGDLLLTVNDGTGALDVFMDKHVAFNAGPYQPGAMLNAAGVLVPSGTGTWQLKPRTRDDASAFYPLVTIAQARALQIGQTVQLRGMALNSRSAFGDATVHLQDATGAIRLTGVAPSPQILAGDTIRVVGTVNQLITTVLNWAGTTEVKLGTLTAPDSVSTQVAATAEGGVRDAGQVAVSGTVALTGTSGGDTMLMINDGSGLLVVILDQSLFQNNPYTVGNSIRVRGVLVPVNGTTWQLKPRSAADVALN